MKNMIIEIDLNKPNVFEQIDDIKRKINKKPWYKRLLNWF